MKAYGIQFYGLGQKKFYFLVSTQEEVHSCSPYTRLKHEQTPLHLAADTGNADIAALLIKHKADLNAKNDKGNTALHNAVISEIEKDPAKRASVVKVLLGRGINLAIVNKEQKTWVLF